MPGHQANTRNLSHDHDASPARWEPENLTLYRSPPKMNLPPDARCETSTHPPKTITVADHEAWRQSLKDPEPTDPIDEALSDPIHDHAPKSSAKRKVRGVLSILDQLDKKKSNGRFAT